MRKPYIAPCCEYMTFTVDSAIAAGTCTNNYQTVAGEKFSSGDSCTVFGMDGDVLFNAQNSSCTTDGVGCCYYSSAGTVLFGS